MNLLVAQRIKKLNVVVSHVIQRVAGPVAPLPAELGPEHGPPFRSGALREPGKTGGERERERETRMKKGGKRPRSRSQHDEKAHVPQTITAPCDCKGQFAGLKSALSERGTPRT